jgi:hypothetical protein
MGTGDFAALVSGARLWKLWIQAPVRESPL